MRSLVYLFVLIAFPALAAELPPDEGGIEAVTEAETTTQAEPEAKPADKPVEAIVSPPATPAPAMPEIKTAAEYNAVILQGLNKVTGKISRIRAQLGKPERFGTIEILAHRCWQASPEDRPEHAALIAVQEFKPDLPAATIFQGWMFSSSPGLSALEHPVYDITVLTCESLAKPAPSPAGSAAPAPAPAATPAPAKP